MKFFNASLEKEDPIKLLTSTKYQMVVLIISILVILLNATEVFIILRIKIKKVYQLTLCSLSLSDLLFGILNVIKVGMQIFDVSNSAKVAITIQKFYVFFVLCSIIHLTWITLDRFLAVHIVLKYKIYITKKKTYLVISLAWIISFVISVILYVTDTLIVGHGFSLKRKEMPYIIAISIFIADVVFITSYGCIIYTYRNKKQLRSHSSEAKLTVTCLLTCCVFVFLSTSCAVTFLLNYKNLQIAMLQDILLLLNSAANSIVYFFRGRIETTWRKKILRNMENKNKTIQQNIQNMNTLRKDTVGSRSTTNIII